MSSDSDYQREALRALRKLEDLGVRVDVVEGQVAYEAPRELAPEAYIDQVRFVKRHVLETTKGWPAVYLRAPREQWCPSCRDLEARGVAVLHCSDCDLLMECPACKRLAAPCAEHYRSEAS